MFYFLELAAEKQIKEYKTLLNSHTKRLEEINILKNCLFIYKPPINVQVGFLFCRTILL